MWEFLDRLVNIALPRVRDFRGVSPRGFDGRGNFTMIAPGTRRGPSEVVSSLLSSDCLDSRWQGREHGLGFSHALALAFAR